MPTESEIAANADRRKAQDSAPPERLIKELLKYPVNAVHGGYVCEHVEKETLGNVMTAPPYSFSEGKKLARLAAVTSRQIRVMVVDPHKLMRRALTVVIDAELDMMCCGAIAMGRDATAEISRCRPDVILLDVSSRSCAGLELVRQVRALAPSVRIVAMAMYENSADAERILSIGAAAFVAKGGAAARVAETVRRAMSKGRGLESGTTGNGKSLRKAALFSTQKSSSLSRLDGVEREIVELLGRGLPTRGIASRLGLDVASVEALQKRIRTKLNSPTPTQLVQFCVRWVDRHQGFAGRKPVS